MKRSVNIFLALLGSLLPSLAGLWAQNNTWAVVMRRGDFQQITRVNKDFPDAFINSQIPNKLFVGSITYGQGQWVVVTEARDYEMQAHTRSAQFPVEFIERNWSRGFDITEMAYGNGEWVVVMAKGANFFRPSWRKGSQAEVLAHIDAQYQEKIYITSLAYGAGEWAVSMGRSADITSQSYTLNPVFPRDWIEAQRKNNMRITSISYGNGQWFVVMSRLRVMSQEIYETSAEYPDAFIKQRAGTGMRVATIHFNADSPGAQVAGSQYEQALSLARRGEHDQAIRHYTEAIRMNPKNAEAYHQRAVSKFQLNQCQGALADANQAIGLQANNPDFLRNRGQINFCLKRCRDAANDFGRVISLSSRKEAAMYAERAEARICLGDLKDALDDYNQALRLAPQNAEYRKAKSDLEARMNSSAAKTNTNNSTPKTGTGNTILPTITWDYPFSASTTTTQPDYEIKACVAGSKPRSTQIFVNGQTFSSRGFGVEDDCLENVQQKISLRPGRNEIEIVATATDGRQVRSEKRFIDYQAQSTGKNHALIIAVGNYPDPGIASLENPARDARRLQQVLTNKYTFAPGDVHLLVHPTKLQILDRLAFLQDNLGPNDNILIFYSGHGIVSNEVGYWLPSDAKQNNRATWLSNAELRDYVNGMKARHALVVADACFSGSILTGGYRDVTTFACEQMARRPSRRAITSGANTVVPDNSVFFRYFVQNLEDNTASCITAEELYNQLKPAVIYNSPNNHIPQFGVLPQAGDEGGNFIFQRKN